MDVFGLDFFEAYWREIMLNMKIESDEIEKALAYYRETARK